MNDKSLLKATVTSKRQITIPKEICEYLDIREGDKITFTNEENKIIFDIEKEKCFACLGIKLIGKNECFVCGGDGKLFKGTSTDLSRVITEISKASLKYKINFRYSTQEVKNGIFSYKEIPTITLESINYPENELFRIQDEVQKIAIETFAPKSIQNPQLFCVPSDSMLDIILDTLITKEAKDEVYKWFRYERTI